MAFHYLGQPILEQDSGTSPQPAGSLEVASLFQLSLQGPSQGEVSVSERSCPPGHFLPEPGPGARGRGGLQKGGLPAAALQRRGPAALGWQFR